LFCFQALEKEVNRFRAVSKTDSEKHEKDLEVMEEKLADARRNLDSIKKKLDQTEADLKKANGDKQNLMNDISLLKREINTTKENSGITIAKANAEKSKAEKELKDATLKIVSLQDAASKTESKFRVDISDLDRTVKKLREDLKSAVLSSTAANKQLNEFKQNREKDLAEQVRL
jgi:chromosome segregation ATPase